MTRNQVAKLLRVIVYVMLVLSAGTAFLFGDRLWAAARGGAVPVWMALLPASTFTVFVLVYAADRWLLVRRRGYPAGRAFFQVAFALVFLSLLWPQQASEFQAVRQGDPRRAPDYAVRLLVSPNPDARAAACELLGLRGQLASYGQVVELAGNDPAPLVREACGRAAARLEALGDSP